MHICFRWQDRQTGKPRQIEIVWCVYYNKGKSTILHVSGEKMSGRYCQVDCC